MSVYQLKGYVDNWIRWLRIRRSILGGAWGAIAGISFSLVSTAVAITWTSTLLTEYAWLAILVTTLGTILSALGAYLWPLDRLVAARYLDREFHLQERTSTALEVAASPQRYPEALATRQSEDAILNASRVDPQQHLPLRLPARELIIFAVLVLVALLVPRLGGRAFQVAEQRRAVESAIEEQLAGIETLEKKVMAMPLLSPKDRGDLLDALDAAESGLRNSENLESAMAALSSGRQALLGLSQPGADLTFKAMQELSSRIEGINQPAFKDFAEALRTEDLTAASNILSQISSQPLSEEARAALIDGLGEASRRLNGERPDLADPMRAAALALRGDDPQSTIEALRDVAETLLNEHEALARTRIAQEAADNLQQGQSRLALAGLVEDIRGAGASQAGLHGGSDGTPGVGSIADQAINEDESAGSAGDAGRGEGLSTFEDGRNAGERPISQDNAPGDGGERESEKIYAPIRLGEQPGVDLPLPGGGNAGDLVGQAFLGVGDPEGAKVPYTDALPFYQEAYRRAISRGEIPVALRSLVKEYFSSLEP